MLLGLCIWVLQAEEPHNSETKLRIYVVTLSRTPEVCSSMLTSRWCDFIPFFWILAFTVHDVTDLVPHFTLHNRHACQEL